MFAKVGYITDLAGKSPSAYNKNAVYGQGIKIVRSSDPLDIVHVNKSY